MDLNASYELCIIINRDMWVAIVYFVLEFNSPVWIYMYRITFQLIFPLRNSRRPLLCYLCLYVWMIKYLEVTVWPSTMDINSYRKVNSKQFPRNHSYTSMFYKYIIFAYLKITLACHLYLFKTIIGIEIGSTTAKESSYTFIHCLWYLMLDMCLLCASI
jgi:hypothetical protein